jgi:ABC-type sulfate/molybdate transport systems ATPase subunit
VALGRALATDPALLLLDEPLSALDLPLRRALRDELRGTLADWGTAAVVVTHDFTEAYRLGDRIIVYDNGRVIQSAPRAELLWQPASEAVARVMGLQNVLEGVVLRPWPIASTSAGGPSLEAVNSRADRICPRRAARWPSSSDPSTSVS